MTIRSIIAITLISVVAVCTGCGGGGGSSPQALALNAAVPALTGKTGQSVNMTVTVTGSGTVSTADFQVDVNPAILGIAGGGAPGDNSTAVISPAGTVCRYKWVDADTIRVLYASSEGASSGDTVVTIPVNVVSETATTPTITNVTINQ